MITTLILTIFCCIFVWSFFAVYLLYTMQFEPSDTAWRVKTLLFLVFVLAPVFGAMVMVVDIFSYIGKRW